ncbi:hypothetical protein PPYR_10773 [Photinus pyralis]|uniref:Coiled-coil domain-containing protein 13 n=1 Tax=Photinus pyralis TaxID=7054 RepID=A0A5N4AH90_PHOPY|nr:hypothetical protein PPYR_10773 [Photinus pyralis]
MSNKRKNTMMVSDDLGLADINIPDIPKDIIFPDDLNKYLRDKVQYLTHENGMLYKNVSDLELQLKESTSKVSLLSEELEKSQNEPTKDNPLYVSHLASAKIVELSKQLRERNSELETYKTKLSKSQQYINELQQNTCAEKETDGPVPEKLKNELEEQIKILQEKLNNSNSKLCETRNSNSQLKANMKIANKLLQQEVGETFENLQIITNSNGNWRGRAQLICDLQQKNSELKEKLKSYEDKEKGSIPLVENSNSVTKWDKKLASLTQENYALQNTVHDLKRRLDAARARNKVIESESSALRAKCSAITEQNEHDRDMITSLTARVTHAQEIQNEALRQKQLIIQELEMKNKSLHLEAAKQECKVNNLNVQIDEQRREITTLRSRCKNHPLDHQKVNPSKEVSMQYLETERLRLLELMKITNDKLDLERNAQSEVRMKYLAEKQKVAKLEARVARLQLEKNCEKMSVYSSKSSLSSLGTVSDDKLQLAEETIKVLQTRLDIERQDHKNNINEFSKILSNYGFVENKDKEEL